MRDLTRHSIRLLGLLLCGAMLGAAGCGGGGGPGTSSATTATTAGNSGTPAATGTGSSAATGTGTLRVTVTDSDGRTIVGADVNAFTPSQTSTVGFAKTDATGTATIGAAPPSMLIYVHHEFAISFREVVAVAQQGTTQLAVTLQPARPRPTAALLPVTVVPGSVSPDRTELTLQVTLVASKQSPFSPAGGEYNLDTHGPAVGLVLGDWQDYGYPRPCQIAVISPSTTASCGDGWGISPYAVTVEFYRLDQAGIVPSLDLPGPANAVLLLVDQGRRMAEQDPSRRRFYAAGQFIARNAASTSPASLSIAGLAGSDNTGAALLPEQPLWSPLGPGLPFTADRAALGTAINRLETMVGGSSPVIDALQAALTQMATQAPAGNRALIALLGGSQDPPLAGQLQAIALTALRRQRDASAIQAVLIAGAPVTDLAARLAQADLAAALHAPLVVPGYPSTWAAGAYAALDLAADLVSTKALPSLSISYRVRAPAAQPFVAGSTLHGAIYLESDVCPMGCAEFPMEFAVQIP